MKMNFEQKQELTLQIRSNRRSIENLLDFAMGYKHLLGNQSYVRTEKDELRTIETIKNLHAQNRSLKKRLKRELSNVISE